MPYQGVALLFGVGIGVALAALFYFMSEQERMRQEQPHENSAYCDNTPNSWTSPGQPSNGQSRNRRRRRGDDSRSESVPICAICLQNVLRQQTSKTLVCGHKFHLDCINSWTQIRRDCPCCRRTI